MPKKILLKNRCPNCDKKTINAIYCYPYCTLKCQNEHLKVTKNCKRCNKEFIIKTKQDVYCSMDCYRETVKDYNNSPERNFNSSRFNIFSRDNFMCVYCGEGGRKENPLVIDHVYPIDKGGKNDIFNLVTCCESCNLSKSNKLISEEQILDIWNKSLSKSITMYTIEEYDKLKSYFDKIYCDETRKKYTG